MLVGEEKLKKAVDLLRSFGARQVLLFGSYVNHPESARDVDLAADGIPPKKLWEVDGAMSDILDMPFDLVLRELNPVFYDIIRKKAKVLYEQG